MQYIYTLSSPENPEIVKYVGYTNNPNRRYNKHLHSYKKSIINNYFNFLNKRYEKDNN